MAKQTCKQLSITATEAFYAEDMVKLEVAVTELQERFPGTAQRLRTQFEDIIWERCMVDEIGEIKL